MDIMKTIMFIKCVCNDYSNWAMGLTVWCSNLIRERNFSLQNTQIGSGAHLFPIKCAPSFPPRVKATGA